MTQRATLSISWRRGAGGTVRARCGYRGCGGQGRDDGECLCWSRGERRGRGIRSQP